MWMCGYVVCVCERARADSELVKIALRGSEREGELARRTINA